MSSSSSDKTWIDLNSPEQALHAPVPAGFVRRWAALFIDQLIVGGILASLFAVLFLILYFTADISFLQDLDEKDPPAWFFFVYAGLILFDYLIVGLYFSLMESSSYQATLGKMALGIKVTDNHGRRLSHAHALGRWFAASLSYFTFYIGFLLAAFTEKKQALHDLLAKTQVVDYWAYTAYPERQQRGLGGCAIAFLVGMALLILATIASILIAVTLPAYSDYRARAQSSLLEAQIHPLRQQVEAALTRSGQCPRNGSEGFNPPTGYASATISRIVVDEFEQGFCGISVWMPPLSGSVERQFLAELDVEDRTWHCTDKAGLAHLPSWCGD